MKIAVLSDTRMPTHPEFPGHGLGKMALMIAEELAAIGHTVTLFAGPGSQFTQGELVIADEERKFAPNGSFDVILDSTHEHRLQEKLQDAAIVNWSHDRETSPGRCAVFPSDAHRKWWEYKALQMDEDFTGADGEYGIVIHNGIRMPDVALPKPGTYLAYLSMLHAPKGPIMAMDAARLAGVLGDLVMAGPTPPAPPAGVRYIGPLTGADKLEFLAGARALIFPGGTEAGPVTILEAQAVGCPVIVSAYGAAQENMCDGLTGLVARDTLEMAEAIGRIDQIKRTDCIEWVIKNRCVDTMVTKFEMALKTAQAGKRW